MTSTTSNALTMSSVSRLYTVGRRVHPLATVKSFGSALAAVSGTGDEVSYGTDHDAYMHPPAFAARLGSTPQPTHNGGG